MPLSVGEKLGPYEILTPIGAGGIGEVLAIKVLPSALARDPERLPQVHESP
jgi:eukaryotic-like serine/threonine-protein kinase